MAFRVEALIMGFNLIHTISSIMYINLIIIYQMEICMEIIIIVIFQGLETPKITH